jgi:hypothetical protein
MRFIVESCVRERRLSWRKKVEVWALGPLAVEECADVIGSPEVPHGLVCGLVAFLTCRFTSTGRVEKELGACVEVEREVELL